MSLKPYTSLQVKEARKATIESKPDILGVRGPVWNETVALNPGKHHGKFSHNLLSNTLTPELINSTVGWHAQGKHTGTWAADRGTEGHGAA